MAPVEQTTAPLITLKIILKYLCRNTWVKYLGEGNEGQWGHSSEHDGRDQHDQRNYNIIAEEGDGSQPATEKDKHDY